MAESGTWTEQPQRIKLELLQPDSRAREALVADAGWSDSPGHVEVELRRAEARAREAIALYGDVDDIDLAQAYRMLVLSLVRQTTVGLPVDAEELAALVPATIDRFERLDEPYGLAIILVLSLTIALTRGDLDEADPVRSIAEVQARRSGERFCRSRVELLSAIVAEARGDLAVACDHVERGPAAGRAAAGVPRDSVGRPGGPAGRARWATTSGPSVGGPSWPSATGTAAAEAASD